MIISCFPLGYGSGQGGGDTPTPSGPFSFTGEYLYIDDGDGDWRVKFLTSGTLTPNENLTVDIFAVGGGSGGRSGKYTYGPVYYNGAEVGYTYEHHSGGGGAGGYTATVTDKLLQAGQTYLVVVGEGGKVNQDGGESSLGSLIRAGGGKMNATDQSYFNIHGRNYGERGHDGGSGGGSGSFKRTGYYQGELTANAGGSDGSDGMDTGTEHLNGSGQGTSTREFGEAGATLYAGGGAGGDHLTGVQKLGGAGGGGNGACPSTLGNIESTPGEDGLGGGGGGGTEYMSASRGGSGIVIIRNTRAATSN